MTPGSPLLRHVRRVGLPLFAALSIVTAPLGAQTAESSDGPANAVTINPFFILVGWVSAHYEHRINSSISVGGGINHLDFDRDNYTIFDGNVRLYPNEHALRGFGVAASLGITNLSFIKDGAACPTGCEQQRRKLTSPSVGVELSYQWMLGKSKRSPIVVAIGGERFLASKSKLAGTSAVIGTTRFGIGYAF